MWTHRHANQTFQHLDSYTSNNILQIYKHVEICPSKNPVNVKLCGCSYVSTMEMLSGHVLVRREDVSYLMAAKGFLKKVNKELNKVNSLYSINLN